MKGLDLSVLKSLVAQFQLIVNNVSAESQATNDFSNGKPTSSARELSDWWDDTDLMTNLHICFRTVRRRRKDGTFKSFTIGRRHYYHRRDILDLRDRFLK